MSANGEELTDSNWQQSSKEISARLGLDLAPRLVVSERVASPMAGGVLTPTVFLPVSARDWDAERRDVVLTHEIAHLAARDPLRHVVARVAVACYWFHPLAWLAAHRAMVSREQACDEAVLAAGTRPSAYARVLLELAESLGPGTAPLTALPMAQRSNLEKRLMTILKPGTRTASSTRLWPIAAVGLALITLSVAAAQPSAAVTEIATLNNVSTFAPPAASAPEPAAVTSTEKPVTKAAGLVPEKAADTAPQRAGTTSACRWNSDGSSFSGSTWSTNAGVTMRVGRSDSQSVVQRSFDGLRVCMVADGVWERIERPAQMMESAPRVSISSERDGETQQMDIVRQSGSAQTTWRVNGRERQLDAAAEEWRRSMLALLATVWETSHLRGQESSLHGQISSIHGHESSLRGRISSIGGRVSSLQGQISSVRGHESSLRGQISSIQGQLSSMRGQISSEQGAISSLNARRYDASTSELQRIDARVEDHRRRIREIEKEIAAFDAAAKVREVEKEIASYDADKRERDIRKEIDEYNAAQKIREVEKEIAGLQVDAEVREIEKQIQALNVGPRVKALEAQQEDQLRRLRAAIAAIR